jgi:hypothetical protein
MWKTLWQWITGPDFYFEVDQCPTQRLVSAMHHRVKWLTDAELSALMDALECEIVNRMATDSWYQDN